MTLAGLTDAQLSRYPTPYADGLTSALAALHGVELPNVATGCGSDDLLDSAIRACCDAGSTIAVASPTFSVVPSFASLNEVAVAEVDVQPDGEIRAADLPDFPAARDRVLVEQPLHRLVGDLIANEEVFADEKGGHDEPLVLGHAGLFAEDFEEQLVLAARGHEALQLHRRLLTEVKVDEVLGAAALAAAGLLEVGDVDRRRLGRLAGRPRGGDLLGGGNRDRAGIARAQEFAHRRLQLRVNLLVAAQQARADDRDGQVVAGLPVPALEQHQPFVLGQVVNVVVGRDDLAAELL